VATSPDALLPRGDHPAEAQRADHDQPAATVTTISPGEPDPGEPVGARPAGAPGEAHGDGETGRGGAPRPRRAARWVLASLGVVLVATLATALVVATARGPDRRHQGGSASAPAVITASATPTGENWQAVLDGLDEARSRAYQRMDEAGLADVYQVGSTVYTEDVALLHSVQAMFQSVQAKGGHVSELSDRILDLKVLEQSPSEVLLLVTHQFGALDFLDSTGQVLHQNPAQPPVRDDITLVRTTAGWRISDRTHAG
jgi:hypothetical protein